MPGTLVISLDFELMWGVRDHRTCADYGDAVLGGRAAIPKILGRFSKSGIRATWATVGLLFARTRDEMLDMAPQIKPAYVNANLSPYEAIANQIGTDEDSDPLHFGRSLVESIAETEGQEIASHTYSHYYCLEEGQSLKAFDADMSAAVSIAWQHGIELKSMVFPRNQMTDRHIAVCANHGIVCYRGSPDHFAYRSRPFAGNTLPVRAYRFADAVLPLTALCYELKSTNGQTSNIPASRYLNTRTVRFDTLSNMHIKRISAEMEIAAQCGAAYHLWWHPHNFGRQTEKCLAQLDQLLLYFERLAGEYGMTSMSMADLAVGRFSGTVSDTDS